MGPGNYNGAPQNAVTARPLLSQFDRFIREVAHRRLILDIGTYHAFRKELAA
jgi:hypothetical protein